MVKNIDKFDVSSFSEISSISYILEVGFEYPDKLHELHNDYPLAPKSLQTLMICYQIVVKKLLINMK